MKYVISPIINVSSQPQWGEAFVYKKENLHEIDGHAPPVNYDTHLINSHNICHIEAPAHVIKGGKTIDQYMDTDNFYGPAQVLKIKQNYRLVDDGIYHHEIAFKEIEGRIKNFERLLLTTKDYAETKFGTHNPSYVLTLRMEAT